MLPEVLLVAELSIVRVRQMLELVTPFPCKQHPLRGSKDDNDDVEEELLEVCSTKHEPPLGASSGGATLSRCTFQTNTTSPLFSCTNV